jgi:hypothetical protein
MRQARTHTWAPDTSPKLKSLQYLSIRVNPEVTEEIVHHADMWVDGGLHLCLHVGKFIHPSLESSDPFCRALNLVNPITEIVHHADLWVDGGLHLSLHVCKFIHPSLESSDPFHHALSLVNPITDIPLQGSIPVRVLGRGRGFGSEARLGVAVRGVVTTTLMVTWVATPYLVSHWGSWGWACSVVVVCCAASIRARPWVWGGLVKLWRVYPIWSNCSVRLSQEYSQRVGLGNRITLRPYSMDTE